MYEIDIFKWKVDDMFFVEIYSFQVMLDIIRKQLYVMFVGVFGLGKIFIVCYIVLILQEEEGYEILLIKDIKDIEMLCDLYNLQLFIVDDVVGVFGFDMGELKKLNRYKDRFIKFIIEKIKIFMICWEIVFQK